MKEASNVIEAHDAQQDVDVSELDHAEWDAARPIYISRYWSGEDAPASRHAEARALWTKEALTVRFVCPQAEPFVISERPQTERKALGLWDRDVCEIFLAPEASAPQRYFEFEAAPTGEWLDLSIQHTTEGRTTDWEFHSGMTVAARTEENSYTIVMRVPWQAFMRAPRHGERWRANLFRCVGAGVDRGYIAWQPTRAPFPNFHVPQAFGWIAFK